MEADGLAGRIPAGLGLAALVALVHSRSGPVGRMDPLLAVADHSPGLLVGRKPGPDPAGYNHLGCPVGRTAVAGRIETFFWKVGIEGSSDGLGSFLK